MAQVNFSQIMHAEQAGETHASASGKNQGTLKAEGKEYALFAFTDTEAVTEAVLTFLQDANQQEATNDLLLDYVFIPITQETIDIESEILHLLNTLEQSDPAKNESHPSSQSASHPKDDKTPAEMPKLNASKEPSSTQNNGRPEVYSSIFSLARSFHTSRTEVKQKTTAEQKDDTGRLRSREEMRTSIFAPSASKVEQKTPQESRFDREGNGKQEKGKQDEEKEGFSQGEQQKEKESSSEKDKKKKVISIDHIQASHKSTSKSVQGQSLNQGGAHASSNKGGHPPHVSIDNIYIRFMALMARILGQAELEAHQLYLRIKERTDAIDVLTLLITKINSEKGAIDWSKDEEMKKLIEKARSIGVDIPEGKYKWSDEEKKLLKENVQMRKDGMEKMTQLERTDMQRYLQEASQCHQARSNVLKLLKEVTDTLIHNMRPS